jgi:hypothetical protein
MTIDFASLDYVRQLRRAGLRPTEKLVQQILRTGEASAAPLIELATETALLHNEAPECYAPIHALRLLGELRPLQAILPLVQAFDADEHHGHPAQQIWEREVPQIIGRFGEPAIAPLWALVDDQAVPDGQRGAALMALVFLTAAEPSAREGIVAGLRERFAVSDAPTFSAHLIAALANLGVAAAYSDVMARFRAGTVDTEVISAGQARQLLLTSGAPRLACTIHPLWERYDEHGPFEDRA